MIDASSYRFIYYLIVILLTIYVNSFYSTSAGRRRIESSSYTSIAFLVAVAVTMFMGLRPVSGRYFIDMAAYNTNYYALWGEPFEFDWSTTNFLFDNLFMFMASKQIPSQYFFLLMASLNFICNFIACKKLFDKDTFLVYLVFLAAFSTFTYATNGIKAGVAAALFLLAIAYHEKVIVSIIFALISYGFHHSMQLSIVVLIIISVIKNPKFYFLVWVGCFFLSALHITFFQNLFAGMTDEQGAGYLSFEMNEHWASVIRFRLDFVLYSAVPVIIGFWMIFFRNNKSKTYHFILNMYLLSNAVWMLCMYAAFTNRIAYLSWFMYPLVLMYPFIKEKWDINQFGIMKVAVYGHLLFTVFMTFY